MGTACDANLFFLVDSYVTICTYKKYLRRIDTDRIIDVVEVAHGPT